MKTVFLSSHRFHKVEQRLGAHAPVNTDDDPDDGATPAVFPIPATDERITAIAEHPRRPWLIQGMKDAL
jgi:hypothetical protein